MAAGGGDFERALGALLALDVAQVDQRALGLADFRLRALEDLGAAKMIGKLNERSGGDDLHVRAGPRRFRPARRRADQTFAAGIGPDRGWQHARDRGDRAIEAEFAEHRVAGERIARQRAHRRHQPERDRQVVVTAFLRKVGRCEVHSDAAGGQREAGGDQRRMHAVARLAHRLVREADDAEGRQPGRHLHLHIHMQGLDTLERDRRDTLDHVSPLDLPHKATAGIWTAQEQLENIRAGCSFPSDDPPGLRDAGRALACRPNAPPAAIRLRKGDLHEIDHPPSGSPPQRWPPSWRARSSPHPPPRKPRSPGPTA